MSSERYLHNSSDFINLGIFRNFPKPNAKMKIFYLISFLLFISCKQNENRSKEINQNSQVLDSIISDKNFIIGKKYEALSLNYNGKPLNIIGEKTDSLKNTNFSFRGDPNLEFREYFGIISDCLSMDDNFQINLDENNSINGILFFSSITNNKQIFTFSGHWTIDSDINKETKEIITDSITKKLFPKLKDKLKIEDGWIYKIETKDFVETFEIVAPKEGKSLFWNLNYEVILK